MPSWLILLHLSSLLYTSTSSSSLHLPQHLLYLPFVLTRFSDSVPHTNTGITYISVCSITLFTCVGYIIGKLRLNFTNVISEHSFNAIFWKKNSCYAEIAWNRSSSWTRLYIISNWYTMSIQHTEELYVAIIARICWPALSLPTWL